MRYSIAEIAEATGLLAEGDLSYRVSGPAAPSEASENHLALAMTPEYEPALRGSGARAAILWPGADWRDFDLAVALFAPSPRVALAALGELCAPALDLSPGIHPSAVIDPTAEIGEDAWIGPLVVIGAGTSIGPNARIMALASIGSDCRIGPNAVIHPGVRIGARIRIGIDFIAQPNAVIGADGFSYVAPDRSIAEQIRVFSAPPEEGQASRLRRINSLGSVEIGDNVEIGAGTAVDRGTVSCTRVGSGTKIDNQVQIGHNAQIGEGCIICGQAGIAGSAEIGDRVVLGGKSGVADHVRIGTDSVVAAGSLVGSSAPARSVLIGAPAIPRGRFTEEALAIRRLPRIAAQIREIRKVLGL